MPRTASTTNRCSAGKDDRHITGRANRARIRPRGLQFQTASGSIVIYLMHLGMVVVMSGQQEPILENVTAPYGATAIAGPEGNWPVTEEARKEAQDLGDQVAEVATWLA